MATQPTNDIVEIASLDTTLPSTGLSNKLEPPTSVQTVGYDANELVPAEDLNYTLNNFSVWLQYLKDVNDETTFVGGDGIDVSNSTLSEEVSISVDDTVVRTDREVAAGNGLTGGGDLSTDRTVTLGTPTTLTDSTTNESTSTSHTHEVDFASAFTPSSALGTTDSVTLPNGLIFKWGYMDAIADNTGTTIAYPSPFPNGVLTVTTTIHSSVNLSATDTLSCWVSNETETSFVVHGGFTTAVTASLNWFAIGY